MLSFVRPRADPGRGSARGVGTLLLCAGLLVSPVSSVHAQAAGAAGESGVRVSKPKLLLVPESAVNNASAQQYAQIKQQAAARRVLNSSQSTVERVRAVSQRLIPHGTRSNRRAADWQWEVNVIDAAQVNAFCMPGGKIMVFRGLVDRLSLTDDELAAVIGHEIAHALLEHGRARMSEALLKNVGVNLAAAYFGLSSSGAAALNQAASVAISLPYSRSHETDADVLGLDIAARAGYDPRGAVSVWKKMAAAAGNQPPQFLSTHPGHATRIRDIEANLPRVLPLYEAARRR